MYEMCEMTKKMLSDKKNKRELTTLYLMNGYQMKGYVQLIGNNAVIMQAEGKDKNVFTWAISTIE